MKRTIRIIITAHNESKVVNVIDKCACAPWILKNGIITILIKKAPIKTKGIRKISNYSPGIIKALSKCINSTWCAKRYKGAGVIVIALDLES